MTPHLGHVLSGGGDPRRTESISSEGKGKASQNSPQSCTNTGVPRGPTAPPVPRHAVLVTSPNPPPRPPAPLDDPDGTRRGGGEALRCLPSFPDAPHVSRPPRFQGEARVSGPDPTRDPGRPRGVKPGGPGRGRVSPAAEKGLSPPTLAPHPRREGRLPSNPGVAPLPRLASPRLTPPRPRAATLPPPLSVGRSRCAPPRHPRRGGRLSRPPPSLLPLPLPAASPPRRPRGAERGAPRPLLRPPGPVGATPASPAGRTPGSHRRTTEAFPPPPCRRTPSNCLRLFCPWGR